MDVSFLAFEGIRRARNLHPLFVHFPLALLPTSLLFYVISFGAGSRDFNFSGRAVLVLAAISTCLAWFTGFRAESSLGVVEPRSRLLWEHIVFGSLLTALVVFLFAWSRAGVHERTTSRWVFLASLALAVALAMVTGDLGAQLVYLRGASVQGRQNPRKL